MFVLEPKIIEKRLWWNIIKGENDNWNRYATLNAVINLRTNQHEYPRRSNGFFGFVLFLLEKEVFKSFLFSIHPIFNEYFFAILKIQIDSMSN